MIIIMRTTKISISKLVANYIGFYLLFALIEIGGWLLAIPFGLYGAAAYLLLVSYCLARLLVGKVNDRKELAMPQAFTLIAVIYGVGLVATILQAMYTKTVQPGQIVAPLLAGVWTIVWAKTNRRG